MLFASKKHEDRYYVLCGRILKTGRDITVESSPVMYLIALLEAEYGGTGGRYADKMFNFEDYSIRADCLDDDWQTSSTRRVTRLAFSLWNGFPSADQTYCNPYYIFGNSWDPYFLEAIKLRFEID